MNGILEVKVETNGQWTCKEQNTKKKSNRIICISFHSYNCLNLEYFNSIYHLYQLKIVICTKQAH